MSYGISKVDAAPRVLPMYRDGPWLFVNTISRVNKTLVRYMGSERSARLLLKIGCGCLHGENTVHRASSSVARCSTHRFGSLCSSEVRTQANHARAPLVSVLSCSSC